MDTNDFTHIIENLRNDFAGGKYACIIESVENLPVELQFENQVRELYLDACYREGTTNMRFINSNKIDNLVKSIIYSRNRNEILHLLINDYRNQSSMSLYEARRQLSNLFYDRGFVVMSEGSDMTGTKNESEVGHTMIQNAVNYYEITFDINPGHEKRTNKAITFFMQSIYFTKISGMIGEKENDTEVTNIIRRMEKYTSFEFAVDFIIKFLPISQSWEKAKRFNDLVLKYRPGFPLSLKKEYLIDGNILYRQAMEKFSLIQQDMSHAIEGLDLLDKSIQTFKNGLLKFPGDEKLTKDLAETESLRGKFEFVLKYPVFLMEQKFDKVLEILELWLEIEPENESAKSEHLKVCNLWLEELRKKGTDRTMIDKVISRSGKYEC